jgi:uncharacterized protein YjiS (DUF1127 family)
MNRALKKVPATEPAMSTVTTMFWAAPLMPLVGIISNPISEWHRRVRCRRELESLSDATLRDIGITRCDCHRQMNQPFWMA